MDKIKKASEKKVNLTQTIVLVEFILYYCNY